DERRRRSARKGVLAEVGARADGDEQVALGDPARVDLKAGDLVGPPGAIEPPGRDPLDLVERERDHRAAPSRRSVSRATSRSSKGKVRSANSWPCSCPLPAMTTTSPSVARLSACSI